MNTLQVYGPFADAGIDELFRGFFKPARNGRDAAAAIKVDVTEKPEAFVVHAEIPGVNKDDIQVTIEGDHVTISAEVKRDAETKDGEKVLRTERYYGAVRRSFVDSSPARTNAPGAGPGPARSSAASRRPRRQRRRTATPST